VGQHWQAIVELGSLLKDRERIEGAELNGFLEPINAAT
jgi:hypothetical protein